MILNKMISALEKEKESRIKVMPPVTYHYWRKEVHISEVLPKVIIGIREKFINVNTQEETW